MNRAYPSLLALLAVLLSPAGSASAQDEDVPSEFRVVVDVKGKAEAGMSVLTRSLKLTLTDEIGALKSTRAFHDAQQKLEIPEERRTYPSQLAKAARQVEADFIVFVRIQDAPADADRGFMAKGYLISAASKKVLDRAEITYGSTKSARRTGQLMATTMVESLRSQPIPTIKPPPPIKTTPPEASPPTATGRPPDETAPPKDDALSDEADPPEASPPQVPSTTTPSAAPKAPPSPPIDAPTEASPPDKTPETNQTDPDTPPPDTQANLPSLTDRDGVLPTLPDRLVAPMQRKAAEPVPNARPGSGPIRVAIGLGSGLLRDYAVRSPAGESVLSYDLPPVFLIGVSASYDLPSTAFGVACRTSLRTAAFDVSADTVSTDAAGILIDGRLIADYRLAIADDVVLRPQAGLRFATLSVDDTPGDVVLSSALLSPFIGAWARWQTTHRLETVLGFDLGFVALYDEGPVQTGDSPGGFAFGLDVGSRYWVDTTWAVTIDGRFTVDQIGFAGVPTRAVQSNEAEDFRDASLSIIDLTLRVGVLWSLG